MKKLLSLFLISFSLSTVSSNAMNSFEEREKKNLEQNWRIRRKISPIVKQVVGIIPDISEENILNGLSVILRNELDITEEQRNELTQSRSQNFKETLSAAYEKRRMTTMKEGVSPEQVRRDSLVSVASELDIENELTYDELCQALENVRTSPEDLDEENSFFDLEVDESLEEVDYQCVNSEIIIKKILSLVSSMEQKSLNSVKMPLKKLAGVDLIRLIKGRADYLKTFESNQLQEIYELLEKYNSSIPPSSSEIRNIAVEEDTEKADFISEILYLIDNLGEEFFLYKYFKLLKTLDINLRNYLNSFSKEELLKLYTKLEFYNLEGI